MSRFEDYRVFKTAVGGRLLQLEIGKDVYKRQVQTFADRENIQIRLYRVIYDILNDVEDAMKGMLDPEFKEEVLGKAEVRETFKVPNIGIIAGSYIQEGKVVRNAEIRLVRDGIVIHEGKISSLRRFKDDAKEVNQGYECGIGIDVYKRQ